MKKFLLSAFCAFSLLACADNAKVIEFNTLPVATQTLLNQYITEAEVLIATQEGWSVWAEYEVLTTDQSKWEFDAKGRLTSVKMLAGIPEGIVPSALVETVAKMYPNAVIIKYSLEDREQEVELNNGIELTFDLKGRLFEADID